MTRSQSLFTQLVLSCVILHIVLVSYLGPGIIKLAPNATFYMQKNIKKIQVGAVRSFSSTRAVSSGVHPYLQFKN